MSLIIDEAVQAAEQAGVVGYVSNVGSEKKKWAIAFAQNRLHEVGLNRWASNTEMISSRIEAAIRRGVQNASLNPAVIEFEAQALEYHDGAAPAPPNTVIDTATIREDRACIHEEQSLCDCEPGECFADEYTIGGVARHG